MDVSILRWMVLLTGVLTFVVLVVVCIVLLQIKVRLDHDKDERISLRELFLSVVKTLPPSTPPPPKDEPPQAMGCDFGVGVLWSRVFK